MKSAAKTQEIIGAAMEVHNWLGPGFIESIYQNSLMRELASRGLYAQTEVPVDIVFKEVIVGRHRLDMLVDRCVIVELKAVAAIADIHKAQLLSYLKATQMEVGIILNFGETSLKWRRMVWSRGLRG